MAYAENHSNNRKLGAGAAVLALEAGLAWAIFTGLTLTLQTKLPPRVSTGELQPMIVDADEDAHRTSASFRSRQSSTEKNQPSEYGDHCFRPATCHFEPVIHPLFVIHFHRLPDLEIGFVVVCF